MEQVFKTKRARRWWIIIVSLVVLIIFLNVYLEQSWAFSALGGIIISVLMFYSQSKTIYIVKDNGVLEIKPGWGNRICVDGIRKVSYNPNAIGMQKVKIEHAQGFVMINPDKPLEFVPIVFYCFINSFGFYAIKLSYIPVYQYFLTPQLNYKFFYLTFVNDFFIVFHPILLKNAESYTFNFILALSISFILHEKNSKNKSKRYNE